MGAAAVPAAAAALDAPVSNLPQTVVDGQFEAGAANTAWQPACAMYAEKVTVGGKGECNCHLCNCHFCYCHYTTLMLPSATGCNCCCSCSSCHFCNCHCCDCHCSKQHCGCSCSRLVTCIIGHCNSYVCAQQLPSHSDSEVVS